MAMGICGSASHAFQPFAHQLVGSDWSGGQNHRPNHRPSNTSHLIVYYGTIPLTMGSYISNSTLGSCLGFVT
ncbi:hypothetical protein CMEL01_00209 [Colletotrichum melonis]|uniref:Uncharacterized protein n=1 Tax=Colletotrichum melonis TaxID=1209925 RepID=A0AAI9V459_9PEZI|nr:hypothetical protein CMEL01_00209 [Colletotrichum melonis]